MTDLRFALFALALALPAQAQNVQSFEPAPGVHSYFSVEGARTTRHKALVPSVWLNYGRNPLVQRDEDGNLAKEYVGHQFGADLMLSYGIAERLEVALAVPFGVQLGDGIEAAGDDGFAFGDIRLLPRYRFIGEPDDAMGVLLSVPLSFPSGNEGAFYGSEGFVIHPKVVIEYRGGGVGIAANVGYRFRTAEDKTANIEVGDSMSYGAGLLVELGSPQLAAVADIFGSSAVGEKTDDSVTSPLEGLLGLRAFMENGLVPSLGGGVGINPDIGTPEYRVVLGVAWVPPQEVETAAPKDTDLDGLVDPEDQCPEEPEDKDGFQDEDGCPDPDNDRDGIADAIDKCPLEPETRNGVTDEDGCPDKGPEDRDGDGLLDPVDACPDEPEDKDGFEDEDGCLDPDNDGDGILDGADQCPLQPETKNGFQDEDGCADTKTQRVQVTKSSIVILDKVYFDLGKATIKAVSYPILNEVSTVLLANPQIEYIIVEGHTDSRGGFKNNFKLSRARARSVVAYLVEKGVAKKRLAAIGYGETQPIKKGESEAAHTANRRVEFAIVKSADELPAQIESVENEITDDINLVIQADRALDPSFVTVERADRGKVVSILIRGAQVDRRWAKALRDPMVKRALWHPSTESPPAAVLRVRMKKRMPKGLVTRVKVKAQAGKLLITIPRK